MALPQAEILYTVADYLAFERSADERHEYLDGYLYAMAGESLNHGIICTNLVSAKVHSCAAHPVCCCPRI